jgi:hypothetical protein
VALPDDSDERFREAIRGAVLILSGEPLRKLAASAGLAMATAATVDGQVRNAEAGRHVHILGDGGRSLCGTATSVHTLSQFQRGVDYEDERRADTCPACARLYEGILEEKAAKSRALREEVEAKRQATLKRRGSGAHGPYVRKTDLAEAFVLARPEGASIPEIAAHIRQNERTADNTMRHVRETRGTVERREGRWYPTNEEPRKPLYQPAILRVMRDATEPMGATDVLACVKKIRPDATLKGVTEELHRMREAKPPMVEQRGESEDGLLYALPGGESPAPVH